MCHEGNSIGTAWDGGTLRDFEYLIFLVVVRFAYTCATFLFFCRLYITAKWKGFLYPWLLWSIIEGFGFWSHLCAYFPLQPLPKQDLTEISTNNSTTNNSLPLGSETIRWGSSDGGKSFHDEDPDVRDLVQELGQKLNLKVHNFKETELYGPIDFEVPTIFIYYYLYCYLLILFQSRYMKGKGMEESMPWIWHG